MTLPIGQLARDTVQIGGQPVEIRSLSRKETLDMQQFKDDAEAGEIYILARATGASEDEVRRFRETTDPFEIDNLLDAIVTLSGIDRMRAKLAAKEKENGGPNA